MVLRNALIFLVLIMIAGCTMKAPVYGLRPEYPENRFGGPYGPDAASVVFVKVDSLHPTFRWESFPRSHDVKEDKQGMLSRIKDVTYDLKIWRYVNESLTLIYSRQGLPENNHKIENPLETCSKYLWTVRARFRIDDQTRVTEWGVSKLPWRAPSPQSLPYVPNPNLYRFKTPCHKTATDDSEGNK